MAHWIEIYLLIGCGITLWGHVQVKRHRADPRVAAQLARPASRAAKAIAALATMVTWPLFLVGVLVITARARLSGRGALGERQRLEYLRANAPKPGPVQERPETIIIDEDLWAVCCRMIDAAHRRDVETWWAEAPALQHGDDTQNLWVYLTALVTLMERDVAGGNHCEDVDRVLKLKHQDWASVTGAPEAVFRDALVLAAVGIPKEERFASQASSGDLLLAIAALTRGGAKTLTDYRDEVVQLFAGTELGKPNM